MSKWSEVTIRAISGDTHNQSVGEMTLMADTEEASRGFEAAYEEGLGKYAMRPVPKLTLTFIVDGTGAIRNAMPVADVIRDFERLVCSFNGKVHEPNQLEIGWPGFVFHCQLASMDLRYEMFSPNGGPLRARLVTTFQELGSAADLTRPDKRTVDLTHLDLGGGVK